MLDWVVVLFQSYPWLITLIAMGVILGGVIRTVYKTWPVIVRFVNTINSLADLPRFMVTTAATLAAQDTQIADIHHEVHFNNGSSVKDAITRVEVGQQAAQEVLERIPAIEKGVAGLYDLTRDLEADAALDRKHIEEARQEIEDTRPRITKPKEES